MTVAMERLDDLVASHLEERLLDPDRLEDVLSEVLDRRQERSDRRRDHIAELNRRAAETELRLKRLYDAIVCARSRSGWRSIARKSGSWAQRTTCYACSPLTA
ncbi:hypothetical protein WKR98_11095 [Pigmentiphaga sp. YJ18]|uniref:hypothetical protein n=1 Tax=unclassified Pigmentiphaga TaxID=2626614 RepID=UPI001EE086A7|nr:hypothetical protein [Pigmentiphaga sp. H8]